MSVDLFEAILAPVFLFLKALPASAAVLPHAGFHRAISGLLFFSGAGPVA